MSQYNFYTFLPDNLPDCISCYSALCDVDLKVLPLKLGVDYSTTRHTSEGSLYILCIILSVGDVPTIFCR